MAIRKTKAKGKAGKKTLVKPPTRMETYRTLAERTDLSRKDVVAVCDALTDVMVKSVKKHGTYNFLGLVKMTLVKKPAVKGGKMVRNPFTGDMVKQKPKPASRTVRMRPLKAIKDRL